MKNFLINLAIVVGVLLVWGILFCIIVAIIGVFFLLHAMIGGTLLFLAYPLLHSILFPLYYVSSLTWLDSATVIAIVNTIFRAKIVLDSEKYQDLIVTGKTLTEELTLRKFKFNQNPKSTRKTVYGNSHRSSTKN